MRVKEITKVEPNAYKSMDKTWFVDDKNNSGYTFAKIKEGDEREGTWRVDAGGNNQFKPEPLPQSTQQSFKSDSKQFKADPDSRESIEWQTSLKAAVEVVRDYHMTTGPGSIDLEDYCKLIDKAAVHFKNLINLKPKATTENTEDVDLPPVDQLDEPNG